jgi:predicted aspartyl protease
MTRGSLLVWFAPCSAKKVEDAASTVAAELSAAPTSVPLLAARAEVEYREGKIAEAAATADQALRVDPCNPRLYLVRARILRLNSMYGSERRAIGVAHSLDPSDLDIRRAWMGTLPLAKRAEEQKQFLAAANGMDPEERSQTERSLARLESRLSNEDKTCHVVSAAVSTELPLIPLVSDGSARHIHGWGLHVFFNNNEAGLELDSGASGLLINRAIAERAGLKPANKVQIGGVGDQGPQAGYIARADSIRVGSLEFRDCIVQVTERKDMGVGVDGLIGTDVFSDYLVTLDYPMRKLLLSQLPPRPGDAGGNAAGLSTEAAEPGSSTVSNGPQDRYIAPTMKDYYPVFRSGHYLILPTLLNNKTERLFMVDSGAFSSSISPEAARAVTKVRGGAPITVKGLGGDVAKVSTSDKIIFQFAGIQQQNNDLISFDTSGLSKAAGIEISGFLGNTVLRELTISIDYRDGLIKFAYDPNHGNHNF